MRSFLVLVIGLMLLGTRYESVGIVLSCAGLGFLFAQAAMPGRPARGDRDSWRR